MGRTIEECKTLEEMLDFESNVADQLENDIENMGVNPYLWKECDGKRKFYEALKKYGLSKKNGYTCVLKHNRWGNYCLYLHSENTLEEYELTSY